MPEQPHPDRVRLLPWNVPDWLVDAVLIAMVTVASLLRRVADDIDDDAVEWATLAVSIGLIVARRRFPVQTLVVAILATTGIVIVTDRPSLLLPVTLVILFNVAQRYERRTAIIAGAATTASFIIIVTAVLGEVPLGGAALASIAWPAFAATAGAALRSTRESVSNAEERALRAEASRELESERRVVEERLRIARDVHDLVAHHLAVVNVQSAVAQHLLASDPPAAEQALELVRGAASTAVDQLGELLGVLRSPDGTDDATAPTPDLAAIDDLISSFGASGLSVSLETSGTPRPMSSLAESTAYRVAQEALTNAHKHGAGTAAVALRFDDAGLTVAVTNPIGSDSGSSTGDGTGFGLIGMRERVESTGGTFSTSTSSGGRVFELSVLIPAKIQR